LKHLSALVLVLLLFSAGPLSAQDGGRGDYLTLKIAVMGPGDELYFWWGHIALVVEDAASGQSYFYDYGIFSFENDHFFRNFTLGRLLYSCGVSPAEANFAVYRKTNRDITLYTLDLPGRTKEAVFRFAERNVLPENRNYAYHHFKDNCATRIRDIIDLALEGQFKEAFGEEPGRYTYRQHVRRHTWFSPFFDWILNFWMGQVIDGPLTVWEEMFLPSEIGRRIENFRYRDSSGVERNLVSGVAVLNRAVNRPAVLEVPRKQWPRELACSLIIAGFLVFLMFLRGRPSAFAARTGRILLGLSQGLLGFFFGTVGLILFFMAFFTNHDYTFQNANLLYVNPLLLAALPLGIISALTKNAKRRFMAEQILKALWTYVLLGGILSMVIKISPSFYQQNQVDQALVLPFSLALSFIPAWIGRLFKGPAGSK
jgi:hypothetical protein